MKIRLTESQYINLLNKINNKKLIITESQYNRLILESVNQFSKIKPNNGIKITSDGNVYTFKVYDESNGELLVRCLNDGRYKSQYFIFKADSLKDNKLIANKSNTIKTEYSDIKTLMAKETSAQWKDFTFKNVKFFEVYKDTTFKQVIKPRLDANTGEDIDVKYKNVQEIDTENIKDKLIKGIEPNNTYLLTFYDDSTLKLNVTKKDGAIITIEFTKYSEKGKMNDYDTYGANYRYDYGWFENQKKLIDTLTKEIPTLSDDNEKAKLQSKLDKAKEDLKNFRADSNREALQSISKSVYKGALASKWVETLENSPEYKFAKELKIDLNNASVNKQKIKVSNKEQEDKINKLNQELSSAETPEDKKRIEDELKHISTINTLHFLNPSFDVYYGINDGLPTFNLTILLSYIPKNFDKVKKNVVSFDTPNESNKVFIKKFSLSGIKTFEVVKKEELPSLTDTREYPEINDINRENEINMNIALDFLKNHQGYKDMLLKRPSALMQLFGAKHKGIIPLNDLTRNFNSAIKNNAHKDKFITNNNIQFKTKFDREEILNQEYFNKFKNALRTDESSEYRYTGIGKVKQYRYGDSNLVLNMFVGNDMYSLFIDKDRTNVDSVNEKYDNYYVTLKVSTGPNTKKIPVAKFTIVIDKNDGYNVNI